MKPTIGRIVIYCLTAHDAEQINRRRTTGAKIAQRIEEGAWPSGAQAHIGNEAYEGAKFPAVVVRNWDGNMLNLKVMLDGTDEYWATSVHENRPATGIHDAGCWSWPEREEPKVLETSATEAQETLLKTTEVALRNTVTSEQIDAIMELTAVNYQTMFGKVTIVSAQLPCGFVIVESSGAVDPENYDANIGRRICMERIKNKVWELEGYHLSKNLEALRKQKEVPRTVLQPHGEIARGPMEIHQSPSNKKWFAFTDEHSISDIVRYAVKCSSVSEVEVMLHAERKRLNAARKNTTNEK